MLKNIETETPYLIPIKDTDTKWQQTCEIPTIHTELKIPNFTTIIYLRFVMNSGKPSLLDIRAGGKNLEITGARIRAQMIYRLEIAMEAKQKPDPPPGSVLEFQEISKYFAISTDGSNVQHDQ